MTDEPELRSHPVTYDLDDIIALSKLVPRGPLQTLRIAAGAIVILLTFIIVAEVWSLTGIVDWSAITVCLIVAVILLFVSNRRVRFLVEGHEA